MKKVLLGESERDLSLSIKRFLNIFDVDCDIASDGVQTLNEFLKVDYEFIILDDNLPRINSIDVIKKIKEKKDDIKIILLSSKSIDLDNELCDDVLPRPFTPKELKDSLLKVGYLL